MFKTIVKSGMAVPLVCATMALEEPQQAVTIVATGLGESAEVSSVIPVDERRPVIAKAWHHLGRLVQRKADGNAKALHRLGGQETWIEWRNLRVVSVRDAGVSNADLISGVTRRYYCELGSEAHRVWNPKRISWSSWNPGSYEAFPWRVEVSWESGSWIARVDHEGSFIAPGGGGRRSGDAGIFRVSSDGQESRVAMHR